MKYHYIQIQINTNHQPSEFIGSMLRGAFGYALKKVTCINPSYECNGCFSQNSCLFYHFYEAQNIFHKYRFDITLGSDGFDFGLYLFDDACDELPYVLSALEMMLTQIGLTKNSYKFNDIKMSVNQKSIYEKNSFHPLDTPPQTFEIEKYTPNIKIKLLTPLRIKKNNKFLRQSVEIEDILRSIYQREQEIFYNQKVFKLDYKPQYTIKLTALTHKSLIRKSNKQKTKMNMDGIIGEIAIMGIDERSYRLLKLGEVIGVGKQTVMGLGKISID
ncbi:MAG: CRISPR system precrRNA processing endoribonuclease RAMP protein Cas6 [Sulfurovum sp.]